MKIPQAVRLAATGGELDCRGYPLPALKSIVKGSGLETRGVHEMTTFSVAAYIARKR
jgi:hypothetical protein